MRFLIERKNWTCEFVFVWALHVAFTGEHQADYV